jgi:hypothetical protein
MYSIEIEDNGVYEAIDYDGELPLTLNNPLFSTEISYSLQASAPFTQKNKRLFKFIHRPDQADNQTKVFNCRIRDGVLFYAGTLTVIFQSSSFNFYFKESGDFWSLIQDKLLSDVAFDKITFPDKGYPEMATWVASYLIDINKPFTFPVIKTGENTFVNLDVKFTFANINDKIADIVNDIHTPVIPFLYLKYIFNELFSKHGVTINDNIFQKNDILKRIIIPNNFILNDFFIDTTVISTTDYQIGMIENTTDPLVTTVKKHNLGNHQLIKISNIGDGLPVKDRTFQIELVDEYSFKLIGEDFSSYEVYNNLYISDPNPIIDSSYPAQTHYPQAFRVYLDRPDDFVTGGFYYCYANSYDFTGFGVLSCQYTEKVFYFLPYNDSTSRYNLENFKFVLVPATVVHTQAGAFFTISNILIVGTLAEYKPLQCKFNTINPANHVPYIKINEFLNECQKIFGVVPFVRNNSVNLKFIKDIINDPDFIDISEFAEGIIDIENPNVDGYTLTFKADGNDDYLKQLLPVQSIDETKYSIKEKVSKKSDLPLTNNKTNDVRFVEFENSYYVFNYSFLNTDNNWKFFCYNLIDLVEGAGDFKIESNFSPVLPVQSPYVQIYGRSAFIPKMDIALSCVDSISDVQMAPRFMYYFGLADASLLIENNAWSYASGDIFPFSTNAMPSTPFATRWDTAIGIKELFLKEYLHWQINVRKDCKAIIHWPKSLLHDFDGSRKYRIRGVDYIVKSIKPTITPNGLKFSETEMVKV